MKYFKTEVEAIESLYGEEKLENFEIQETNFGRYYGWYIKGYPTIASLRIDFPLDATIKELYELEPK